MSETLTKQDIKFAKVYAETGNGTQAAKKGYGITNYNYAKLKGHQTIKKKKIKDAVLSLADSIPDELVLEKHLALLNKEEVITKNNMTTGEIDIIPTGQIDVQSVKAGLDMAYKLKGSFAPEKSVTINFDVEEETLKEIIKSIRG